MIYDHKQPLWQHMPYLPDFNPINVAALDEIMLCDKAHLTFVNGELHNNNLPSGIKIQGNTIEIKDFNGELLLFHSNTKSTVSEIELRLMASNCYITQHITGGLSEHNIAINWHLLDNSKVMHAQHMSGSSGAMIVQNNLWQEQATHYQGWRLSHSGSWLHEHSKIILTGDCSQAEINSLVLGFSGNNCQTAASFQHLAQNTLSKHNATLLIDANARGICYSDVFVDKAASGSFSEQYNRNIALASSAEMISQPRLCINNEHVVCSHGATTGELDQAMLGYMNARGISSDNAKRLLVLGYANAAIAGFPEDSWSEFALQKLTNNLDLVC